jgi:N-acetylgalactosamine-6-sulfatase
LDGVPILQQVAAGSEPQPRTLFWRARRGDRTWRAVRDENLKYVSRQDGQRVEEFLFDLAADPGESRNLIDARPEDAQRLKRRLDGWHRDVQPARKALD